MSAVVAGEEMMALAAPCLKAMMVARVTGSPAYLASSERGS